MEEYKADPAEESTQVEETTPPASDVVVEQPTQAYADNAAEVNLKNMRAAKELAEKERLEFELKARNIQEKYDARILQYEQQAKDLDYGDDDLVEGKHLKKEIDGVKAELKAQRAQAREEGDEARLKIRFKDFEKVVTNEAIAKLKESDPEFAETIAMSSSSLYARGSSTYRRIKELGIYIEDKHEKDRLKAQENANKPRPMNSISPQTGDSALGMANAFANGLTSDLKKQLWKEMQDAAKRH